MTQGSRVDTEKLIENIENCSTPELDLNSKGITPEILTAISTAISGNSAIRILNIQNNALKDKGAKELASIINSNCSIFAVNIGSNSIGDDGIIAMTRVLSMNSTLTHINLELNSIGDSGAKAIAKLLVSSKTLVSLNLSHNKIGNDGLKMLCKALYGNFSLVSLDFSHNSKIGLKGCQKVAAMLAENKTLTTLRMNDCEIGSSGAQIIAQSLQRRNNTISYLGLSGCNIKNEGARAFASVLAANFSLTHLDISSNKIDIEGFRQIMDGFFSNHSLRFLNFKGNNVNQDEPLLCSLSDELSRRNDLLSGDFITNTEQFTEDQSLPFGSICKVNLANISMQDLISTYKMCYHIDNEHPVNWMAISIRSMIMGSNVSSEEKEEWSQMKMSNSKEIFSIHNSLLNIQAWCSKELQKVLLWNYNLPLGIKLLFDDHSIVDSQGIQNVISTWQSNLYSKLFKADVKNNVFKLFLVQDDLYPCKMRLEVEASEVLSKLYRIAMNQSSRFNNSLTSQENKRRNHSISDIGKSTHYESETISPSDFTDSNLRSEPKLDIATEEATESEFMTSPSLALELEKTSDQIAQNEETNPGAYNDVDEVASEFGIEKHYKTDWSWFETLCESRESIISSGKPEQLSLDEIFEYCSSQMKRLRDFKEDIANVSPSSMSISQIKTKPVNLAEDVQSKIDVSLASAKEYALAFVSENPGIELKDSSFNDICNSYLELNAEFQNKLPDFLTCVRELTKTSLILDLLHEKRDVYVRDEIHRQAKSKVENLSRRVDSDVEAYNELIESSQDILNALEKMEELDARKEILEGELNGLEVALEKSTSSKVKSMMEKQIKKKRGDLADIALIRKETESASWSLYANLSSRFGENESLLKKCKSALQSLSQSSP